MWVNPNEIKDFEDNDGNDFIDDIHGIDVIDGLGLGNSDDLGDKSGHGTNVAGIISADGSGENSNSPTAWGLAPQSKIMALRFMNADGEGSIDDAIKCIDYAIEKGARIINAVMVPILITRMKSGPRGSNRTGKCCRYCFCGSSG